MIGDANRSSEERAQVSGVSGSTGDARLPSPSSGAFSTPRNDAAEIDAIAWRIAGLDHLNDLDKETP